MPAIFLWASLQWQLRTVRWATMTMAHRLRAEQRPHWPQNLPMLPDSALFILSLRDLPRASGGPQKFHRWSVKEERSDTDILICMVLMTLVLLLVQFPYKTAQGRIKCM